MQTISLKNKQFFKVITPESNNLWLVYEDNHTVGKIIKTLKKNFECYNEIYYNSETLQRHFVDEDFTKTPSELGIGKKEIIVLTIGGPKYYEYFVKKKHDEINNKGWEMKIYYMQVCDKAKPLHVSNKHTIKDLNFMIHEKEGILPHDQRLIYKGKQLDIDKTLADYNIQEGDILNLFLRLRGGMYSETSGKAGNYGKLKNCIILVE
jgi:uncharacterized ubiquitin-like protein YukD